MSDEKKGLLKYAMPLPAWAFNRRAMIEEHAKAGCEHCAFVIKKAQNRAKEQDDE